MKKEKEPEMKLDEKPFDFETFECKTIEDIRTWNFHARKAHRQARMHDKHAQPPYPIKIPDASMHKQMKIKFQRFDQPENILKVRVRNKDIDWSGQIKGGCVYELPLPVVKFLNRLAVPIFAEVKVEDGGETKTETRQVGERNRFSCQLLDMED